MTSRALEWSALTLIALAAALSATAFVLMFFGRSTGDETSTASAVEAVVRIRAQGEAREFDARVGALRIVSSAENQRLSRALAGIEAIRRIEDRTGRSVETEAAMAIGFEEARASLVAGGRGRVWIDTALVGGAGLGALAAGFVVLASSGRRRNDRRRIATGLGLDAGSGESEVFADEVLLQWIRRSAHKPTAVPAAGSEEADRPRLTVVEASTAPPAADEFSSSFGPTRRR